MRGSNMDSVKPSKLVHDEDQVAAMQMSWRETPLKAAHYVAILQVECHETF